MDAADIDRRLDGKTVLVTGAAGFIGSAVCARLALSRCRIIRVANAPLLPLAARGDVIDIRGGVRNLHDWRDTLRQSDAIIHLAAQTSVYAALEDPLDDLLVNAGSVVALAREASRGPRPPHLVIAGTATEAGLTPKIAIDESFPEAPITFYDLSKLTAERYLRLAIGHGWVTGTALRLANVFGPGPKASDQDRGILNKITRRACDGHDVTLFGDGRYLRDFIYVDDAAEAFVRAAALPEATSGETFIVASGTGILLRDAFEIAIDEVAARTGRRVALLYAEPPHSLSAIEFRDFVGNPAKLHRITGWRASTDLRTGIRRVVDAFTSGLA